MLLYHLLCSRGTRRRGVIKASKLLYLLSHAFTEPSAQIAFNDLRKDTSLYSLCPCNRQDKTEREKDTALHMETQYNHLSQDFKVEEKALVAKTKAASQYVNQQSGISLNSFALAEKEGIRGYSSGPGTTCTRAEARAREQRAKLLRVQRNLATR